MPGPNTLRWITACAVFAMLGGGVAAADEHEDVPVFLRQDVWFHQADTPVGNLHGEPMSDAVPSWDTNEPTDSHPLGAGAVYASNNYSWFTTSVGLTRPHDTRSGPTFAGTYTGDMENMAVELFAYMPVNHVGVTRLPAAFSFDFRIDGQPVLLQDEADPSYGISALKVDDDGLYRIRFVLTNLYRAMEVHGIDVADDAVHDVHLNVTTFYAGTESVFVFDSAEAPAGAVFNLLDDPMTLATYTKVDVFDPPPPYSGALPARQ